MHYTVVDARYVCDFTIGGEPADGTPLFLGITKAPPF
jgi:hypothetical protein